MTDTAALLVMLGVFGQVPVNDFLIGTMTSVKGRSRAFGTRYLVSFTAFSAVLPFIAFIQSGWGFDGVFRALLLCPEPPPLKWSAPIVRKAEDQRWRLRDPSPKRLS